MERRVAANLEAEGVEIFLPLIRLFRRPRHKRRPVVTIRAWANYIFVRPPPPIELRDARLLIVDGRLAEVRDEEVETMMARKPFLIDEYVEKKSRRERHRKGDVISARHSVFGAVEGVVREESASMIRLELTNGMNLSIPASMITPETVAAE